MSTAILGLGVVLAALMPVFFHYLPKTGMPPVVQGQGITVAKDEKLEKSED
jgi:hypothetical protein